MVQDKQFRGALYIVAAPSGAGKTSLVKALVQGLDNVAISVSTTTRKIRSGEVDGVDYHFVDKSAFEALIAQDQFIEHAQVFDNYYGTSRDEVETQLDKGVDVILEIDWQGAHQVRDRMPACCSIYVLPPSRPVLEQRLQKRGQDDQTLIDRRMRDAINEMVHYDEFDYVIINDDFDQALAELGAIFIARRLLLRNQQHNHKELLQQLLS